MSGTLYRIHEQMTRMSKTQKRLGDYILSEPEKVIWYTTAELAEAAGVSNASVSRFCQESGFDGFKQFKLVLAHEVANQNSSNFSRPESEQFKDNIAENLLKQNISALTDTESILSVHKVRTAAKFINQASAIMCAGVGASDLVAQDMIHKLLRMEKQAFIHSDHDLRKVALRQYTNKDLVILFSYSGEKREMIELAKQAKSQNVPIIAITRIGKTELSKWATITLEVAAFEHDFRSSALSSRIVQLYMVDVLFYTYGLLFQKESMERLERTYNIIQKREAE